MSKRFSLNKEDLLEIIQVLAWSGASAVITALLLIVQEVDFAEYTLFVPIINTVLYAALKFVQGKLD